MRSTSPRRRHVAQGLRAGVRGGRQAGLRREADGAERRRVRGDDRGVPRRGRAPVHGLLPPRDAEVRADQGPARRRARSATVRAVSTVLVPAVRAAARTRCPGASIPRVAGGGLFVDLAPHTLDFLDYALGPDRRVAGDAGNQAGRYPAEDVVSMRFSFAVGRARHRPVGLQRRRRGRPHRDARQPGPARVLDASATTRSSSRPRTGPKPSTSPGRTTSSSRSSRPSWTN